MPTNRSQRADRRKTPRKTEHRPATFTLRHSESLAEPHPWSLELNFGDLLAVSFGIHNVPALRKELAGAIAMHGAQQYIRVCDDRYCWPAKPDSLDRAMGIAAKIVELWDALDERQDWLTTSEQGRALRTALLTYTDWLNHIEAQQPTPTGRPEMMTKLLVRSLATSWPVLVGRVAKVSPTGNPGRFFHFVHAACALANLPKPSVSTCRRICDACAVENVATFEQ
jgi:hypothetical protein